MAQCAATKRCFWEDDECKPDGDFSSELDGSMAYMFYGAVAFNRDLNTWIVANVIDMSYMFGSPPDKPMQFNGDISEWNVANVKTMHGTFEGADAWEEEANSEGVLEWIVHTCPFNVDISKWVLTSLEEMPYLFNGLPDFNADISKWNVSKVVDSESCFAGCKKFNADISGWDVRRNRQMSAMFQQAETFNRDLNKWDVSNIPKFDPKGNVIFFLSLLPPNHTIYLLTVCKFLVTDSMPAMLSMFDGTSELKQVLCTPGWNQQLKWGAVTGKYTASVLQILCCDNGFYAMVTSTKPRTVECVRSKFVYKTENGRMRKIKARPRFTDTPFV